ncbi:MAG: CHAT domain-containing protein, partial [Proteobacteria bacterium]|nr:CHAT domain-containing protein [Pseudomonadota bacterium]
PKASPLGATVAAPSKQVEKLTLDLQKILHGNTAEAINGYVRIGDSGLLESEALDFANQHLEIAKNNAQDAREDKLFPEAKRFFMEALHYAEILKLPSEALSINDSLVKTLFQARDYQSALHFQNRRVRMLTSAGAKEEDIAAAEMEAGILATRAGIGSIARQHLRAAETFYQKDQDEEKLPQIYHYIGLSYEGEGEFQKTIESYEQSRSLSDKVGRKIDAAQKLLDIGNIYKERLSNLPLALDFYGKAFEAFEKLGQQDRLISVQIDRANTLMAIGETKWAINVIERRVLNAIEPATNPGLWIRSAQIVANAYYRAGMFEESQAYITKIRATIPDLKDETSRANASIDCDNLWAMNSEKLGNHGDASVVFDQSLKLARKFKLRGKESMILNNIGFWAREAGDVAQSLTYFEQALAIDKDLKSEADQAYDLRNMAMSWTMLGNLIQASSAAQQALDASSRLKLAHNEAYSLFALAEIQMKKSAPAEAVKLFQRAKEVAVKAYLQDFVWRADAAIANVEMGMKNLDKAAIAYANSVTIIESMRAGLSSQSSKTGFASDRGVQDVYAGIVRVLMKLGRIEEAWVYSERGRARSFIDALGSKAQTFGDAALDQAMEEERRLRSDEEVLERRLATTPEKSAESVIVKAALAKANADRKIKITEVTTKWPRVTPFIGVQKMDLSIVKGRLNQETAILEFMCLDEETAYWVIQNGVIHGGLLTIKRKELNDKISQYRELMQNFAAVKATARDLTEILLKEPLKHLQSTKELIIVPHGELHYLPFASLPVQDHFLLDQFSVSYLESAEMLRFSSISARKIFNGSKLIAFGNPDRGPELNLPFAEREVHALGRSFKNSKSIFGKDASEKNFVTMIRDVDIVHFAGHGEFNESDAAASRLLFAKSDDLTVKEMLTLQMPVSLVTLSACETGLGKLSSGDEMVGFNRALFFSGAASVVSSLWRVSDVASSVTIKRFYSELAKGTPKAEALRKAQIVVRKYYNHPAYWSAFKLSGER